MTHARKLAVFGATLSALMCVGCASLSAHEPAAEAQTANPVAAEAQTALQRWVAAAAAPTTPIACSVPDGNAPEAVARFRELAQRINTLYGTIYGDAQRLASGERLAADATGRTQAAITARYQEAIRAIESARTDLSDYTASLRDDSAISNITQRLEWTRTLVAFGKDTGRLAEQLSECATAANLLLREGLSTSAAEGQAPTE